MRNIVIWRTSISGCARALAGIHDGGNVVEDAHFHGGQYGIMTRKPSPGWQYTLVDTSFEGQSVAAIRCHEAGLTLVRPDFRNVPTAIAIDENYAEEPVGEGWAQ